MTLKELFDKYHCDKGFIHHYEDIYTWLLSPYLETPCKLLEIGVLNGSSIRVWYDYLPLAEIIGVDICIKVKTSNERIRLVQGDATNQSFVDNLISTYGPFDIIIDDGSHFTDQTKRTFDLLWPAVKPGGIYFIEDVHAAIDKPEWHLIDGTSPPAEWIYKRCQEDIYNWKNQPFCWTIFAGALISLKKYE